MKVHLRKKKTTTGHSLLLDYFLHGSRVREYLGIHITKGDSKEKLLIAERIRAQKEIELFSGQYGLSPSHRRKIDFIEYFQDFIDQSTRKDKNLFNASLAKLIKFHGPQLPASSIDARFCSGFFQYLLKSLNGESPYNYFKVFKAVLSAAVTDRLFISSPASGIKSAKPAGVLSKQVLTDSEIKILFKTRCGNAEVKRAFLFACFTGLRAVDVRSLTWKEIDMRNKEMRFSQSKTSARHIVPLNSSAISILGKPGIGPVFKLPSQNGMNKDLKNWVKRSKIKKHITFHCARHTFGTSLLIHGADLKTTSVLLGHSSTRETEKYTHISDKMKRKAVDQLERVI